MRRWSFLIFFVVSLLLFGLSSCTTTKVEKVTEYVTVPVDITDVVEPVYRIRPDNSDLQIADEIRDFTDILNNSATYLRAWLMWQTYAEALEDVITSIEETYGPEKASAAEEPPL